jgi:hypothetical protein
MKKNLLLIVLMLGMVTLKAQIFIRPPLIISNRDVDAPEYLINLPEHREPYASKSLFQTDQTRQSSYVIHKYYTLSNYDVNVYGTDALEMDGYIYLNGIYRDKPPGAIKPSIWKHFTIKLDQNGNKVWVRTDSLGIFDHGPTYMHNLIRLSDGSLLSMGEYVSFDSVQRFINEKTYFIKSDTAGNLIWSKIVELPDSLGGLIWSVDVLAEPDGGFTTQAYTVSESRHFSYDSLYYGDTTFVTIVKFDSNANIIQMNRFFVGTHKTRVMCSGILKTEDGGYLLAGHNEFKNDPDWDPIYNRKYYILKIDSGFNLLWTKIFDQSIDFVINKLCLSNSITGGYLFATSKRDTTYPIFGGYIHYGKLDSFGNYIWDHKHAKMLDSTGWYLVCAAPMGIVEDELGNVVIAAQVNGFSGVYLFCSDTLGNEKWSRWIPYWGEFLYNMRKAESDGFLITGIGAGAWLAKTDSIGCVMPGCIDTLMHIGIEEMQQLKSEPLIAYPNPVNDILYVTLNLPNDMISTAELFDLQGKLIASAQPMTQLIPFNVTSFPSGLYVLKVITKKGKIITKKVVKR